MMSCEIPAGVRSQDVFYESGINPLQNPRKSVCHLRDTLFTLREERPCHARDWSSDTDQPL